MSSGIIENSEMLKLLYLNTDITDISAVQTAKKEISENVYVAGKEKYMEALNAATPANIAKAKKYNNAPTPMRYLGWGVMAFFFAMAMIFDDSGMFEESTVTWPYVGFWVGVAIQIYIAVLKSAWSKLTITGTVIHPALKTPMVQTATPNGPPIVSVTQAQSTSVQKTQDVHCVFCGECGRRNKVGAETCENCGAKL